MHGPRYTLVPARTAPRSLSHTWPAGSARLGATWREARRALLPHVAIVVIGLATTLAAAALLSLPAAAAELDVLFLGNSHTNTNDLPGLVEGLATAGGHSIFTDRYAVGNYRLEYHAEDPQSLGMIAALPWDHVVLQEYSVIPAIEYMRDNSMYPASRKLDGHVHQNGSSTLFFMTWARELGGLFCMEGHCGPDYPDFFAMQEAVSLAYRTIAEELAAGVAPVGDAWALAKTLDPDAPLFNEDHNHATLDGTYLGACVFYATLFAESPVGLDFTGGLEPDRALFYQQVAAGTVTPVDDDGAPRPQQLHLASRPNPFNPATTIEFALATPAFVTLGIFDPSGRQIATLTEGLRPAGTHRVKWSPSGVTSGVYLCRLTADSRSTTHKLTLVR